MDFTAGVHDEKSAEFFWGDLVTDPVVDIAWTGAGDTKKATRKAKKNSVCGPNFIDSLLHFLPRQKISFILRLSLLNVIESINQFKSVTLFNKFLCRRRL